MSLLSVIQRANVLVGLRRPSTAGGAPDATSTAQMAEMARIEAESLAGRHDWSGIIVPNQFTTTHNENQWGALPDDFDRFTRSGGLYGPAGAMDGPLDRNQWGQLTSFPLKGGGYPGSFRVVGGRMQIYPAPQAAGVYRFDYITKNIYQAVDGTPKAQWALDTDICLIPEDVIALGVVWRWLQFKGLDYSEALRNAELEFEKKAGADSGRRGSYAVGNARRWDTDIAYPWPLGPNQ